LIGNIKSPKPRKIFRLQLEIDKRKYSFLPGKKYYSNKYSLVPLRELDVESIKKFIQRDIPIISLEEHNIIGGLGSAISEVIADTGIGVKFLRLGINDRFSHFVGSHNYQKQKSNLTEKPKLRWFN